jgi:serine/threonine protein kinase
MIHNDHLSIILSWVDDLCIHEGLVKASLRVQYLAETSSRIHHVLRTHEECIPENYQLYAIGCIYTTSCYISDYPLTLSTLHKICDQCYTPQCILSHIYEMLAYDLPIDMLEVSCSEERLADHGQTTCDLVTYQGIQMVCKKIQHRSDGLPKHDAVIEIVVHRKLKHMVCQQVNQLKGIHIDSTHTHLFYEYLPISLDSLCGGPLDRVPTLLVDIISGIKDLHDHDIAHRDIKLPNIQCTLDKRAKIIDLGSAGYGSYRETIPICTMSHRSPEILIAEDRCTFDFTYDGKKLDMWSLGVIALELFLGTGTGTGTGGFPKVYEETSPRKMLRIIQKHKREQLLQLKEIVSPKVLDMIRRCLLSDPKARPEISDLLSVFVSPT